MYLWCAQCNHAHLRSDWEIQGFEYGGCPSCGCSEYRNALAWEQIASANNYPLQPDSKTIYLPHPVLF